MHMTTTRKATPAKAIKKELTKLFPAIKFSCRYSSFSMGDSVDISWIDWPTTIEIDKIVNKYKYWSFDGITDMYNITNSRDDIPQAKYVSTSRSMSEKTKAIINSWAEKTRSESDKNRYYDIPTKTRHLFYHYSITSENIEIKDTGATARCGIEEKYAIINN